MTKSFDPVTLPPVLESLADVMLVASEQLESEERVDVLNELRDTLNFDRQNISWTQRLGCNEHLKTVTMLSGLHLVDFGVQHACSDFLVGRTADAQWIISTSAVQFVEGLSNRANVRDYSHEFCVHSVLRRASDHGTDVIATQVNGTRVVGTISQLWSDAIDLRCGDRSVTVPMQAIESIRLNN